MASEYLKWKYRDVKPDEKIELTPAERRKNWWYYHKFHVLTGVVLLSILGSILWNALHQVRPDYQIAYIGEHALPDDTAAAIEAAFAGLGEDLNGDGSVVARLVQYASYSETDAQTAVAAEVKLMADVTERESFFFLLEAPGNFQKSYHVLSRLDGALPEANDYSVDGSVLLWEQCPVLAAMDLGDYSYDLMGGEASGNSQELLSGLYIGRRGYWTEDQPEFLAGLTALWEKLIEGAAV